MINKNEIYKCDYQEQWIFDDLYVAIDNQIKNNTYLIIKNDEAVVIDTSFNSKKISQILKNKKIKKIIILITHGHFDHVGESVILADKFNCNIYIHKKDLDLKTKHQAKYFEFLDTKDNLYDKFIGFENQLPKLPLNNFKVKVLETPGHTPGSVCYLINNYVFTGDFIFDIDIGRTDFDYSNENAMQKSIKLFLQTFLDKNFYLFPGHEEWTLVDNLKIINPYIKKYIK